MTSKRLFFALWGALGILLLALIAGVYGANQLLTGRATQLTALKAKSAALSQQQLSLAKGKKDLTRYADLRKIAAAVVPEDKNQAEAVREIVNIAAANGVSLVDITFPASTLGTSATGAPGASTAAPTSPTAPNPAANLKSKTNAFSQLQPVKNLPGVYVLPITVAGDPNQPVPYAKFIGFLHDLEHNRRTAQVSAISLDPDSKNHNLLTFTLTLNEYIKP